jgi:uncharacterized protein YukE
VVTKIGMDADAVRGLASKLDAQAAHIGSIIRTIDGTMSRLQQAWRGPDVQRHVGWWQQQHRPLLLEAQEAVAGLAQSARNNATEQDEASGATGGRPAGWAGGPISVAAVAGGAAFFGSAHEVSRGFSTFRGLRTDVGGSTSLGGLALEGRASAYGGVGVDSEAHARLSASGADLGVSGRAYEGVGIAATGSATYGIISASGSGSAFVGNEASGNLGVKAGADGIDASAGFKGFSGAEATASGSLDVGGVGGSGSVSGYAGIGIEANAHATVTAQEVKVQADLGAALGLGGAVKVEFEAHPGEIANNLQKALGGFFHI